jgi:hypothetical protein
MSKFRINRCVFSQNPEDKLPSKSLAIDTVNVADVMANLMNTDEDLKKYIDGYW